MSALPLELKEEIIKHLYEDPAYVVDGRIVVPYNGIVYELSIETTDLPNDFERNDDRTIWL